ncbi:unnamed protein product [Prorocentrum cordatum]|uniref:EF-hand domain-containing protein n=1 Tax=Prorocentrum cordatum TaxID=2364126 RepID=A0ABN9TN13_9DINO|nr:unnamed protein product [Polarella glacialis]
MASRSVPAAPPARWPEGYSGGLPASRGGAAGASAGGACAGRAAPSGMFRCWGACGLDNSEENVSDEERIPAAWRAAGARPICELGAKCTLRMDPAHLEAEAHVWDPDYQDLCEQQGVEPLEATLRVLFDWVDLDASGKVSREELGSAMPFLSKYFGDDMRISPESWKELDEDGNGYVNFSEFAEWAGPRLGLPLGVGHLFGNNNSRSQSGLTGSCCGIMNCPCKEYREKAPGICRCGHKRAAHHSAGSHTSQVPYPSYWKNVGSTTDFVDLVPLRNISVFQDLFDHTHIRKWTRDRIKHTGTKEIPRRYTVTKVWRVENSKTWREYCVKKALMMQARQGDAKDYEIFNDVKSSLAWVASSPDLGDQSLEESVAASAIPHVQLTVSILVRTFRSLLTISRMPTASHRRFLPPAQAPNLLFVTRADSDSYPGRLTALAKQARAARASADPPCRRGF